MRDIMRTIRDEHQRHPSDNDSFLDAPIAGIATVTGRLYGQSTYDRLIRSTLGIEHIKRRPSAPTIQRAIAWAQSSAAPPTASGTARSWATRALRRKRCAGLSSRPYARQLSSCNRPSNL